MMNWTGSYWITSDLLKRIGALFAIGGLTVFFVSCGTETEGETSPGQEEKVYAVQVVTLQPQQVQRTISISGRLEGALDISLEAETQGRIVHRGFDIGDRVRAGDTIIIIDDRTALSNLHQAEANRDLAALNREIGEADYKRATELHEAGSISDAEFDAAKIKFGTAVANHKAAVAAYERAVKAYEDTRIIAEHDGYIADISVEEGEMTMPGRFLARIVVLDSLKVRLGLAEDDVVDIAKGNPAQVRVDVFPGEEFTGTVAAVSPASDETTGTYAVDVYLDNNDGRLKPGMTARVSLVTDSFENALLVDADAIIGQADQKSVFVVQEERAKEVGVITGRRIGNAYVVKSGLAAGDRVVVRGQHSLTPGVKVYVEDST
jgi:membrane fusion protein (multidrug efflux system)